MLEVIHVFSSLRYVPVLGQPFLSCLMSLAPRAAVLWRVEHLCTTSLYQSLG